MERLTKVKKFISDFGGAIVFVTLLIFLFSFQYINWSSVFIFIEKIINFIPFDLLGDFSLKINLILLGITIPIFVFTATLLGNAVEIAKEEKTRTEKEINEQITREIQELKSSLDNLTTDNLAEARNKISELEGKKAFNERKIKNIDEKYKCLDLKNSVLYPSALFIAGVVLSMFILYVDKNGCLQLSLFLVAIVILCLGVNKIIKTLIVVQEVAIVADNRRSEKMQALFTQALEQAEEQKKLKPSVVFNERSPFVFNPSSENEIKFRILLKTPGADEATNLEIYLLISPEIDFIKSSNYGEQFKQPTTFSIPNANTIIYKIARARKRTLTSGKVKIKTTIPGNFKLRYKIDCDGYSEASADNKEMDIIVKD